ncbi:hypothetical protein BVRB_004740 [Beta vulgaris subsp. vulgaris]|uniref:Methionyl/Leucyl tRNA synthetase domain-containing protein n=1 Tax=Beta vulgaris subsp. vulgaris TaxID=3555 RepID=A0A0J8B7P9_BETVV|nr:hypothetical protein BVRB_004740 [Beta vulgaris subsp. vulgaris]
MSSSGNNQNNSCNDNHQQRWRRNPNSNDNSNTAEEREKQQHNTKNAKQRREKIEKLTEHKTIRATNINGGDETSAAPNDEKKSPAEEQNRRNNKNNDATITTNTAMSSSGNNQNNSCNDNHQQRWRRNPNSNDNSNTAEEREKQQHNTKNAKQRREKIEKLTEHKTIRATNINGGDETSAAPNDEKKSPAEEQNRRVETLSDKVTVSNQQADTSTKNLLDKQLQPKCITRDLKWGVPVPFPEKLKEKTSDSRFSWEDLQAKLNSELADNLGNFMNRVFSFVAKPTGKGYNSVIPDVSDDVVLTEMDTDFVHYLKHYVQEYVKALEKGKLKDGLKAAMAIANEGNRYFQVLKQLQLEAQEFTLRDEDIERVQKPWKLVCAGHKIGKPYQLFRKLVITRSNFSSAHFDALGHRRLKPSSVCNDDMVHRETPEVTEHDNNSMGASKFRRSSSRDSAAKRTPQYYSKLAGNNLRKRNKHPQDSNSNKGRKSTVGIAEVGEKSKEQRETLCDEDKGEPKPLLMLEDARMEGEKKYEQRRTPSGVEETKPYDLVIISETPKPDLLSLVRRRCSPEFSSLAGVLSSPEPRCSTTAYFSRFFFVVRSVRGLSSEKFVAARYFIDKRRQESCRWRCAAVIQPRRSSDDVH